MKETITYIFRKPDPKFKSIEGVFNHIKAMIGLQTKTSTMHLKSLGGGLSTLWSNVSTFKRDKDTIYHITGDVHYMALVTGKKTVLTIHDVNSILKRDVIKKLYLKLFWFWLPAICVKRITVISNFTKLELEKIIPFAKHKISVVNNPVNELFAFSDYNFNQSQPRILLIGTKPNKNLEMVLKALSTIPSEIVLIGKPTDVQKKLVATLDLNFESRFNLSINEVVEEFKKSDLLCFASTYEGFGMPIIEAQAVGRPVITSNLGAMKEVAADTAYLVNPHDLNSIRLGVKEIIENRPLRQDLIKKGLQNVERFKSENVAKEYMHIYRDVSSGN
ncbi:glycosyltransferase family 4 protein [Winogradskyella schleiferi]|uniref:glycosyltransferase family 4 protein n=1 Tax=Winogradskyella schleiferi TaxID=2686078 RepID=UPI0015BE8A33|nr:glycosyltransferase family 1 protein [Winogradskyella schleiferi]